MGRLKNRSVPVVKLSRDQVEEMWHLMDRHYENVSCEKFQEDLSEKDQVILLEERDEERIRGFSTLKLISLEVLGRPVRAIFSGDTIIDPKFWGEQGLVRELGKHLITTYELFPDCYCCWFLISKGYKTYRFLPLYFKRFFPCFEQETPAFEQAVIDTLATARYPGFYDCKTGLIRLNGKSDWLRSGIADLTDKQLRDPNTRFFSKKNPGYLLGDELACVAELSRDNLKKIFFRIVLAEKK